MKKHQKETVYAVVILCVFSLFFIWVASVTSSNLEKEALEIGILNKIPHSAAWFFFYFCSGLFILAAAVAGLWRILKKGGRKNVRRNFRAIGNRPASGRGNTAVR